MMKRLFYKLYTWPLRQIRRRQSMQVPLYALEERHIAHTQWLTDRVALLHKLHRGGTVAELGVDEGTFSQAILSICQPKELHLIDLWKEPAKLKRIGAQFSKDIREGRIKLHQGPSVVLAAKFPDAFFDWIYIDTDHSYATTIRELELYAPKIKAGGIIAGHDFITGNWEDMVRYGVIEAVYEFCSKYEWEILYLTTELDVFPSFALQKISIR